jgi:hypothetical protein
MLHDTTPSDHRLFLFPCLAVVFNFTGCALDGVCAVLWYGDTVRYDYSQYGVSASRRIYQLTLLYPTGTFHLYRRPIGAGSPFFSYSASRAAWSFTQAGSGRCDICKFWAKDFSVRAQVVFEVKRSGSIFLSPCIAKLYPGEPPRINLLGSISTGRLSELIPYWRAYFIFVWYI